MTSKLYLEAAAALAARGVTLDDGQQQALVALGDWLAARLKSRTWFNRTPKAAYFYGSVGRGKSMLLDSLFAQVPVTKSRIHLHALLQRVQHLLLAYAGKADPLVDVADTLEAEAMLWFFDEFHVHDIGDAILLGRLLDELFKRNVIILFSSNYAPDGLCPNPLYTSRFKPFVVQIKRHSLVLEMGLGCDYRPLTKKRWGRYIQAPSVVFHQEPIEPCALVLGRREVPALKITDQALWINFAGLCQRPLAASDYLDIANRFEKVVLTDVPAMASCTLDEQQRLINFIDIAYDTGLTLWLHSELALDALCKASQHGDFSRTHSRLAQLSKSL